jgi:hypothetical protein
MPKAPVRIALKLYTHILAFLAGMAVGIWSGVLVALFVRYIVGAS